MRNFSPRERRLAITFFGVLLLAFFWQLGARPLFHRLLTVSRTLSARQEVIARAKSAVGELPKLEADNKTLADQRQLLLLSGEVIPQMIIIIGQAAKEAKVGEVDIRPLPAEKKADYVRQPMQLQCRTSFLRVKDFLFYLENGGNPLLVERLEISSEKDAGNLQATLSVAGYALPTGGEK